jgi:hypothetical protein
MFTGFYRGCAVALIALIVGAMSACTLRPAVDSPLVIQHLQMVSAGHSGCLPEQNEISGVVAKLYRGDAQWRALRRQADPAQLHQCHHRVRGAQQGRRIAGEEPHADARRKQQSARGQIVRNVEAPAGRGSLRSDLPSTTSNSWCHRSQALARGGSAVSAVLRQVCRALAGNPRRPANRRPQVQTARRWPARCRVARAPLRSHPDRREVPSRRLAA